MKYFKVILIAIICLFLIGLWVSENYAFKVIPSDSYNPTLDYKVDLIIQDLTVSNISPSGFSATFGTEKNRAVVVEWTVYPSDMFMIQYCGDSKSHSFTIDTYPEGGTIVYRITDGIDWLPQHGTDWYYQDLPRPVEDTVLPPPYYQGSW